MPEGPETELVLVYGADRPATATIAAGPRRGRRSVLVAHDLRGLDAALLTDEELALGPDAWRRFTDPFEHRHTDPCDDRDATPGACTSRRKGGTR